MDRLLTPDSKFLSVAVALMALVAFAIAFNGAYFTGPLTLCVVGSWLLLGLAVFIEGEKRPWPGIEKCTVLVLGALWIWSGISVIWSISADLTWIEFNRSGAYFAVFALGILVSRQSLASISSAWIFMALAAVTAFYAVGVKTMPGIVENPDSLARISIPLGYTNAVGLLMAMPVPLAIFGASSGRFPWYMRTAAAAILPLLLVSLFFTLSRGAMVALIFGLLVYFVAAPLRLRSFFVLLLGLAPATAIAVWSSGQEALMSDRMELGRRMAAAAPLRIYLAVAVIGAGTALAAALLMGRRLRFPARMTRIAGAGVLSVLIISLTVAAASFAVSKPSFPEWARDSYQSFTRGSPQETGAARLFEFGLSSRWRLWEEALANWEEHRLTGTGAQSFPLVHLKFRQSGTLFVKQPHGLFFRLLTELGIPGLLMGGAFIALVMTGSMLNLCRARSRWEKGMIGAMSAVGVTYLVHASYDWDWNMPALTMPFMFFMGIALGWRGSGPALEEGRSSLEQ